MVRGQVIVSKFQFYTDSMIYMPFPLKFRGLKKRITDGRTDGRTDRPSYRDAWKNLKRFCLSQKPHPIILEFYQLKDLLNKQGGNL